MVQTSVMRDDALAAAIEEATEERIVQRLNEVAVFDNVLFRVVAANSEFGARIFGRKQLKELLAQCARWSAFEHPDYHRRIRARERELLATICRATSAEELRETMAIVSEAQRNQRMTTSLDSFIADVHMQLTARLCGVILDKFARDSHFAMRPVGWDTIIVDLLVSKESPIYCEMDLRVRFMGMLGWAAEIVAVQINAIDLIGGLSYAIDAGDRLFESRRGGS
jgi:hypothetical protein